MRPACLSALWLLVAAAPALADDCTASHWVGSWSASPSDGVGQGYTSQTERLILTPHLGGSVVRVHLSNRFSSSPLTFSAASVALRSSGADLAAGSLRKLTFAGAGSVTAPPGGDVVSDPVQLSFRAFEDLAVNVFVAGATGPVTEHFTARQTSYASAAGAGDLTGQASGSGFSPLQSATRPFVDGVDVMAPGGTSAVAAFGDSITDGFQGQVSPVTENTMSIDANLRYPDDLARRLQAAGAPLSVLNAGISGNRVLMDGQIPPFGPAALSRVGADVLAQAGVRDVIVLEGINDIGQTPADAPSLEAGLHALVAKLHAGGVRVLLGTLTPAGGTLVPTYGSASADAVRQAVNAWIRSGASGAERIVDFDAAVRDPADRSRLLAAYDGSDHLHFSPAGYQALADAVQLADLRGLGCGGVSAGAGAGGVAGSGSAGSVPGGIACASRRRFLVHIPRRFRRRLRRADVYVNGRHAGTLHRGSAGVRVDLRKLPRGVARVRFVIRLRGGTRITQTRRYRTCARTRR